MIGPLPPPIHGVAVSTRLALDNDRLRDRFTVEHIDTSDPRPLSTMERWDAKNVTLGLKNVVQLMRRLRPGHGVVYVPASTFIGAFLRDSLFIHAGALAGWKVAVHIGNSWFREFYDARGRVGRWWIRATLGRAAGVALLGPRLIPSMDGIVPADRIAVVDNGTPDFEPVQVVKHEGRVLFFGNFLRGKGIAEAVEAALIVTREQPDAEVVFAGEWYDRALQEELLARAAEADGRIRFIPPVGGRAKEELLQSSAALIFPARENEGQPRAVLETLCRGIPFVATRHATFNLAVSDGEDAFVLDEPDAALIADRVLLLLRDDELRARMGRAARTTWESRYSQELADQGLADWLTGLAG